MAEAATALVVSRQHLPDVFHGGARAVASLVAGVEAFPHVLVVTDDPDVVEPLTAERSDIGVVLASNFRELAYSEHAPKGIAASNVTTDTIQAARTVAQRALSSARIPAVRSQRGYRLAIQALATLVSGWMGDQPEPVVSFLEQRLRIELKASERGAILTRLRAVRLMLAELRPLADQNSLVMTEALRQAAAWEAEPQRFPGHVLALRVSQAHFHSDQRKPRRSDLLDLGHAAHFPYVDIATCDSSTLAALRAPGVGTIAGPRRPVLLKNRHLPEVVAALRRRARNG